MEQSYLIFLSSAVVISLSGVMSPGPMTAAVISHGGRSAASGIYVALGHGVVEFPLIFLIFLGAGNVFENMWVRVAIGALGGAYLIYMGRGLIRPPEGDGTEWVGVAYKGSAFSTGIALSVGNPYFLLWWATVGVGLVIGAVSFGTAGLVIFAIVHWLLDLIWFAVLSFASNRGVKTFGTGFMRKVNAACGVALFFFGGVFIINSIKLLIA